MEPCPDIRKSDCTFPEALIGVRFGARLIMRQRLIVSQTLTYKGDAGYRLSLGNTSGNSEPRMSSPSLAQLPPHLRSRVSNGSAVLVGVNAGSALGRRFRDIIADLTVEMGGFLSASEVLQVRAAASLQLHVEDLTARLIRGEPVDSEELTRAGNSAIRALAAIKRKKEARRASKGAGVSAYLAARAEAVAA